MLYVNTGILLNVYTITPSIIIDAKNIIIEIIAIFVLGYDVFFFKFIANTIIARSHSIGLIAFDVFIIIDVIIKTILISSNILFKLLSSLLVCFFFISFSPIINSIIKFAKKSHKLIKNNLWFFII
jgi:hypothetical protein